MTAGDSDRAIVVGAGHNGLVAANYLADAGLSVTVLERRELVGGACVTEELIPGFRASSCAFVAGPGLEPRVASDLGLGEFGLRLYQTDPLAVNIAPSGRAFSIHSELDRTVAQIRARFGREEAMRFIRFGARLQRVAAVVRPALLADPPGVAQIRTALAAAGDEELYEAFLCGSVGELLDANLEDPELKGFMAFLGLTSVLGGPYTTGTAYVYSHHSWGDFDGRFGEFGYARGGMGAISQALASRAASRGVEIRTDAEVERILVEDGRAKGVVLPDGEELVATVVVSNADPRRTLLGLVGRKNLDPGVVSSVEEIDYRGTMARVHVAVERLPRFAAYQESHQAPHRALTMLGADIGSFDRAAKAQEAGEMIDDPCIELTIQSVHDDTLVDGSGHIITTGIQQLPFELADGTWDDARDRLAEQALSTLDRYAPGVRGGVVGVRVITPLDLERDYGLTEGNLFHGAMNLDQIFSSRPVPGMERYRTPIGALYLCGAGTHPGGGVTGAPGHNGARAVLRDLGLHFNGAPAQWRPPGGRGFERLGRIMERPGLQRGAAALAGNRWLRPFVDRAKSR